MARSRQTGRQAKQKQTPTEEGKQATKPDAKHKTSSFPTGNKAYMPAFIKPECNETFEVWGKLNSEVGQK
jgi:hypothetical protein|tara:strand:+ start:49 stop:258 length:210 start_codon:yes stop_codon:yes gene_type:complete